MKLKNFNILIFLIYLISSSYSYSIDEPNIKNLVIHKQAKKIDKMNQEALESSQSSDPDSQNEKCLNNIHGERKIGRNEVCPSTGKKYKHCCGALN